MKFQHIVATTLQAATFIFETLFVIFVIVILDISRSPTAINKSKALAKNINWNLAVAGL